MNDSEQKRVFDEWLNQHKGLMFKVVRAYAFNAHDQEDLFQEIVVQVWNSIPGFKGNSAVTTWIYRVALNSALAWTRKEIKRRDGNKSIAAMHTLAPTLQAKDCRLDWLFEQIGRMDEIERSLMLLMLDGFSYKEMAEVLGITESNVGVKINRLKKQLSNILREEQIHEL